MCMQCGCNHIRRLRYIFASGASGYFMYHRFLTFKSSVCHPQSVYVFCVGVRINSCHFPMQHLLIGFYNRDGACLLHGTFYIPRSAHTVYLCVLCGSENKQRLFHCTALTDWFYNRDGVCLLHGTFYILRSAHTVYLCVLCGSENKQRLFHCTALTNWFL